MNLLKNKQNEGRFSGLFPVILQFSFLFMLFSGISSADNEVLSTAEFAREYLSIVENSDMFNPAEKIFTRKLLEGARADDTFIDAMLSSPMLTERNKQYALKFFREGREPKQVEYKDQRYDTEFELVSPRLRFSGDVESELRFIETRNDISDYFAQDNSGYNDGITHVIKGNINYRMDERHDENVWGRFDFDVQDADGRTEKLNAHIHNRENWHELGTMLTPYHTEFGLRNTEIGGVSGHFERQKWGLDYAFGETVEDFIPALDKLLLKGFVLKRALDSRNRDMLGVSLYNWEDVNYYGGFMRFYLSEGLHISGELMRTEGPNVLNDDNAWETRLEYENDRVIFLNQYQNIGARFSSVLNPKYANIGGFLRKRENLENAFTYRFDPYVTSSATHIVRRERALDGRPQMYLRDYSWVLSTQKPDKPKYMVVLKASKKDDAGFSTDEERFISMARTTFRNRDMVTSVDFMFTNFDNYQTPWQSYILRSLNVDFSRPFLKKLYVRERLGVSEHNYADSSWSNESQSHLFEAVYRPDQQNSFRGSHQYRRMARRALPDKYKMVFSLEARRKIDANTTYKLLLESFNYNEFLKGYDATMVSLGCDFTF
jgi:hypothetical protein